MQTNFNMLRYNPILLFKINNYKAKIIDSLNYIEGTSYGVGKISLTKDELFEKLIELNLSNSRIFDTALNQLIKDRLIRKTDSCSYLTTEETTEFLTLNKSFIVHLIFNYIIFFTPIILSIYAAWNKSDTQSLGNATPHNTRLAPLPLTF